MWRAVAADCSDVRNDPVRPIKFAVAGLLLILSYGVWRLTQASSASHGGRQRRRETQGLRLLLAEGFRRVRRRTGGGTRTCWLRAIPRPPRHRGRRGLGGAPRRPDYAIRHGSVCRLAGSGQVRAVHLGGGPDVRALKEGLAGCLQVGAGCRNSTQTEGTAIYPLPYRARRDAPFARTS